MAVLITHPNALPPPGEVISQLRYDRRPFPVAVEAGAACQQERHKQAKSVHAAIVTKAQKIWNKPIFLAK
jgi:hypothetical protein